MKHLTEANDSDLDPNMHPDINKVPGAMAQLRAGAEGQELWIQLQLGHIPPSATATEEVEIEIVPKAGQRRVIKGLKNDPSNHFPRERLLLKVLLQPEEKGADIVVRQKTAPEYEGHTSESLVFVPEDLWGTDFSQKKNDAYVGFQFLYKNL